MLILTPIVMLISMLILNCNLDADLNGDLDADPDADLDSDLDGEVMRSSAYEALTKRKVKYRILVHGRRSMGPSTITGGFFV